MTAIVRKLSLVACLLAIASCGSEEREETFGTAVFDDLKAKYAARGNDGAPAQRDLSWIETNTKPLTIVLVEKWQGMGFLALQVQNGPYKTWRGKDGTTITFKGGFMTGTKGLGDDLLSASVPSSISSSGSKSRTNYYLDPDDQVAALNAECEWKYVGSETIPIMTKSYTTKHFKESCNAGEIKFRNDYWLDSGGVARQSRQFVSESVGYVSLLKILE